MTGAQKKALRPQVMMLAPFPFPSYQGTQVLCHSLAESLHNIAADVEFLTYASSYANTQCNFPIHRITNDQVSERSGPSLARIQADSKLLKLALSKPKPDIVHAHNAEGLVLGIALKMRWKIPLVFHAHNLMGFEISSYFQSNALRIATTLAGFAFDFSLPRIADRVVLFDAKQAESYRGLGVHAAKLCIIPPGLNFSDTKPLEEDTGKQHSVVYAGNPDRYQNLPLLYRAYKNLKRTSPLRIFSHAPHEDFFFELRSASMQEGSDYIFERLGPNDWQKPYLGQPVFACPRVLPGGAPIKGINALKLGCALVATRSGAASFTGLTPLAEQSVESFARHIQEALLNPEYYRCTSGFDAKESAALYQRLYSELMDAEHKVGIAAKSSAAGML